jgi:hypothetical protein
MEAIGHEGLTVRYSVLYDCQQLNQRVNGIVLRDLSRPSAQEALVRET